MSICNIAVQMLFPPFFFMKYYYINSITTFPVFLKTRINKPQIYFNIVKAQTMVLKKLRGYKTFLHAHLEFVLYFRF